MMTKPLKQWKLPQPTDIKEDNEWIPIPRISRTIPYGYDVDPDDPDVLLPNEHQLDMLMKANQAEVLADSRLTTLNGREASIKLVDIVPYILSSGGVGGPAYLFFFFLSFFFNM